MNDEFRRNIVAEIEADLFAMRLKKQLNRCRDDAETIFGCHVLAAAIAVVAIAATVVGRLTAGATLCGIYVLIGLLLLPAWSRRNADAHRRLIQPLSVLLRHGDSTLLDERMLQSDCFAGPRHAPAEACRGWPVEHIGRWLTARGLYVQLPSTDGTPLTFLQTDLGRRVRGRLNREELLPMSPLFGRGAGDTATGAFSSPGGA